MRNRKEMKELFKNSDNDTAKRIADTYPIISKKKKDELYSRIQNRVADMSDGTEFSDRVSGVEVRHGSAITRYAAIAAACALIVGGIGGGTFFISRNLGGAPAATELEEETIADENEEPSADENETAEDVSEEETAEEEVAEETPVEYDYQAIALELTDRYLDGIKVMEMGDASYDESDSITFYTYDSTDAEWSSKYGGERTFYRVTDERFNSCQDIYDYYKVPISSAKMADSFIDGSEIAHAKETHGAGVVSWLGGDVSIHENGSRVDLCREATAEQLSEEAYAALNIHNSRYVDYNGVLYVRQYPDEVRDIVHYNSEPVVTETGDGYFAAYRYYRPPYSAELTMNYGEQQLFEFVLEDGEWKITSQEIGMQVEYYASIAVQCYLEGKPEYNDINIDPTPIMSCLTITEYDEEAMTCKVHGILKDVNGDDAIEITADINLNVYSSSLAVTSAEITRLNDYDGTLKRPSVIWAETHAN